MQRRLLLLGWLVSFSLLGSAQIVIDNTTTAQQMAQMLVGNGVRISNAVLTAPRGSYGKFTRNGSSILLDSGIVLTTGQVNRNGLTTIGLAGPASSDADDDNNAGGDRDLDNLIGGSTQDACVLEFDFVPVGDSIKFRYIFSSDEYPDYNCSDFNDVFAFFISGPGIVGQPNLALVPGTNIPVAINSINSGRPGLGGDLDACTSMGAGSPFVSLYVDNAASTTVTHNGFTVILTAKAAVIPCGTYHIKLAIADVGDGSVDSGVFLEAGSFNSAAPKLVPNFPIDANGNLYLAEGCHTGSFTVKLPATSATPTTLLLQYQGAASYGTDYNPAATTVTIPAGDQEAIVNLNAIVDNVPEGSEPVKIYLVTNCRSGLAFDSLFVDIRDYDTLHIIPESAGRCPSSSAPIQLQINGTYDSYSWTPPATLNNPSIANPIASPTGDITYIATTQLGTCQAQDSVVIRTKRITQIAKKDIFCVDDGYIRLNGNDLLQYPLQFSINNGPFQPDSNFNNLAVGTYTVSIQDATNCRLDSVITLVRAFPVLTATTSTTLANCNGANGSITITAGGGTTPYQYSINGTDYQAANNFTGTAAGSYTAYVKDNNNCLFTIPVTVNSDPPITITTTTSPASCSGAADGSITVTAAGGSGTYSFALVGGTPQSDNILAATSGTKNIIVADNTGCTATATVTVPLNNTLTVDARTDSTICEGKSVTLTTVSNGTSFSWQPTAALDNAANISPVASPSDTTKYHVTATLGICTRQDSVTINVLPAPTPNAGRDTAICLGGVATLNASGGVSFLWGASAYLSATNIFNPTATPPATTTFGVKVTDALGCTSIIADSVVVTIRPSIIASAGRDTTIAINQPLQLQASGGVNYIWQPITGLSNPNIDNPIAVLQNDITYLVTVSDIIGCRGTASIRIKTYKGPEIYVPNAFTPNGDGRNDVLKAIAIGFRSFDYFTVMNRWGEKVFTTNNPSRGWDGTYKGVLQNQGNYVWIARGTDYLGNIVERKGYSILIR